MTASTLRAAAAIIDAAAVRGKHSHWTRIADELQALADEMTEGGGASASSGDPDASAATPGPLSPASKKPPMQRLKHKSS